jgi:hypothetical protein
MIDADTIARLLAQYKTPGILLYRPYPPVGLPRVRSRLGGLPNLPDSVAWPYGRLPPRGMDPGGTEVPLHFLAQIDCAELPRIDARMPDAGLLFFFARQDEETIWGMPDEWRSIGYQAVPHDDCRVIYVAEVARDQPIRCPPSDLPPIGENWGAYDEVLPNKPGPSVHLAWPLFATTFDTWPDSSAFYPPMGDDGDQYDSQVEAARIQSFFGATGFARRREKPAEWQRMSFPPSRSGVPRSFRSGP